MKDFDPVTLLAWAPNVLVTHPSVAAKSVQELIALTKKSPGALNYASSGSGSSPYLSDELFKHMTNTDILHVPYKGGGPAVASLLSSETKIGFATMPSVLVQTQSGKLRALAVTGEKRSPAAPDLPTIAEAGVAGYAANGWYSAMVPAGTPEPIVARLHKELIAAVSDKGVQAQLARLGFDIETGTPDDFRKTLGAQIKKWSVVVKAANLRADWRAAFGLTAVALSRRGLPCPSARFRPSETPSLPPACCPRHRCRLYPAWRACLFVLAR